MTVMSGALPAPPGGGQHRRPIIAAAIELTARSGWPSVTMARLAELVGVSRQTVYNEIGSKAALAEAMVAHELDRFLSVVGAAFDRHPDDLVEAIYDAVRAVLELADDNTLLRAIVSATHGTAPELLPLLTTDAGALLARAKVVLGERVRPYRLPLADDHAQVVTVGPSLVVGPGQTTSAVFTVRPGSYVLLDNLPWHYWRGAWAAFTAR